MLGCGTGPAFYYLAWNLKGNKTKAGSVMAQFNLNVGFRNELGVSQELRLAPQLLQWLNILQASSLDLSAMVQAELATNPALEIDGPMPDGVVAENSEDPVVADEPKEMECSDEALGERLEYLAEIDGEWRESEAGNTSGKSGSDSEEQEYRDHVSESITRETSLQEHLMSQLRLLDPVPDLHLCEILVGSLDERGYLTSTPAELAALAGSSVAEMEQTLATVQRMDPPGVAAVDLRECLLLQLRDSGLSALAETLVSEHLQAVGRRQYRDLAVHLGVREEEIRQAVAVIQTLNPAPGQRFTRHVAEYVEPDAVVTRSSTGYVVELTDQRIPRLRLSASVRRLLEQGTLSREEVAYIRGKIRAAAFLIQGITQRQDTLKKTVEQIATFQGEFLGQDDGQLNALTMASVARVVGVHETTISRAISNKYLQTPRGLFPMRHFFQAGLRCADGSRMTPQRVKELLATIIRSEDACAPLMDRDIVLEMGKRGLRVARRTVAKYREEMGIPASKDRVGKKRAQPLLQPQLGSDAGAECAA